MSQLQAGQRVLGEEASDAKPVDASTADPMAEAAKEVASADPSERQQAPVQNEPAATCVPEAPLTRSFSASSRASSAISSQASQLPQIAIGGNLTSDTSSVSSRSSSKQHQANESAETKSPQRLARRKRVASATTTGSASGGELDANCTTQTSDNEEYQSARVDLGEEEDDAQVVARDNDSRAGEYVANFNPDESAQERNVTKIKIEHERMGARPFEDLPANSPERGSITPLTARLKLHAPRSLTSPSPTIHQFVDARSPQFALRKLGSNTPVAGDSASQLAFPMHHKYQGSNHFEIRWQNIRLYARPKSFMPNFVTNNCVFQALFPLSSRASSSSSNSGRGSGSGGGAGVYQEDAAAGHLLQAPYSPPLNHHKIFSTIDENFEMNCPKSQEAAEAATAAIQKQLVPDEQLKASASQPSSINNNFKLAQAAQAQLGTTAEPKPQTRCILNNVSGQVFSGQMTAVLGPSGVGKTSLLNSLTGRNTLDGTGRVSLIGAYQSKRMSVVTVPQVDVLPSKLTTWEDLHFTSRLKNPQSGFDHERNIERLVKHLHMEKFLYTKIDKLSGGEARRLSIARELLSSPDIMILDEPTSGLDANTCKKIITALRNIVEHSDNILEKPMSIIITIHQPQQEVYQLFHRIYVMAIGGRVVYEGAPELLLPTVLEQSSISRIVPADQLNENPAIVAIEVASGEFGPQVIDELAMHHDCQVYEEFSVGAGGSNVGTFSDSPILTPRSSRPHKSPLSVSRFDMALHRKRLNSFDGSIGRPTPIMAKRQLNGSPQQMDRMSSLTSLSYASTYDADLPEETSKLKVDKRLRRSVVMKSHFINHTLTLIERCWLLTIRDLFLMSIRILGFLLVAAGMVQIFSHALDPKDHQCPQYESDIDDLVSYIGSIRGRLISLFDVLRQGNSTHLFFFHLLLCITMVTSALTGLVFPLQMRMFIREYKNGWYSPASFIMSQTIAELPADIVGPLLTLLIAYPLCNQPESLYNWRLFAYIVVVVLCSIICKSQAQIIGALLMDSVENSVFISCVCVTGPALLSGIPLRIGQMIEPLQVISYGSFLRYAFESLLELRYGFGMCPCDEDLIHGPIRATPQAIPAQLENLATGLLELNGIGGTINETINTIPSDQPLQLQPTGLITIGAESERENLFLTFLRLITDASNMFVSNSEISNCKNYRSLYLINMDIQKDTFTKWMVVMALMFIISRFLTYFVVKTVIKLRRT